MYSVQPLPNDEYLLFTYDFNYLLPDPPVFWLTSAYSRLVSVLFTVFKKSHKSPA